MNLYLLRQDVNTHSKYFDSCVVCAENEDEAKRMHPNGIYYWNAYYLQRKIFQDWDKTWTSDFDRIHCMFLGIAEPRVQKGVLCSSFNDDTKSVCN